MSKKRTVIELEPEGRIHKEVTMVTIDWKRNIK
nr:MAG TPA: hypothetical protein [Caudoviricetes sp.]